MQKVDKEKTRYYLAKIHILFRGNFRTQEIGDHVVRRIVGRNQYYAVSSHDWTCFT